MKKLKKTNINDKFDLKVLNEKELKYFKMTYPKSGVPFFTSEPGIGKSAIMRGIAKKLNLFYIDLRLAMLDETDVGLFPNKTDIKVTENGEEIIKACLDHIVPRWAHLANKPPVGFKGTLIHFEELNRAPLAVRNAALQILLEKCIGYDFSFNEDVYMVSTGNLGEEDGTDVEEFDSALNGRLLHYKHTLNMSEWVEYFAEDNVQSIIIRYLAAHPDHYYVGKKSRTDADKSYASPRTWTFLSDYITENYGADAPIEQWITDVQNVGHAYIGSANTGFLRYLRDTMKIGINDIMNKYPQLKKEAVQFTRDKKSELLTDLRRVDFDKLKQNQIENIKLFMIDLGADEVTAFLIKLLDEDYDYIEDEKVDEKNNQFILSFLRDKRFKKFEKVMLNYVKSDDSEFWDENKDKDKK